jgi:hypothetical protein
VTSSRSSGNRVQHALRAFTPEDAKALKATVSTFPRAGVRLGRRSSHPRWGTARRVITLLSDRGGRRGGVDPAARPQSLWWRRPRRRRHEAWSARRAAGTAEYAQEIDRDSAYDGCRPAGPPAPAQQRRGRRARLNLHRAVPRGRLGRPGGGGPSATRLANPVASSFARSAASALGSRDHPVDLRHRRRRSRRRR